MFNCPHCRHLVDDAPDLAGQMVACPACGGLIQMPILGQLVIPEEPVIRIISRSVPRRQTSPVAVIATATVLAGVVLIGTFFVCKAAYDEWQLMRVKQEAREALKHIEKAFDEAEREIEENVRQDRKRERWNIPQKY